ncbi:MAG TPA: sigma-70 family RNA polymerase sigma factor [Actinomycetota bacterium]|nr:sigma-70 family RNA polymerase sigma factor [Actinomycetota bacterium]
MQRRSRSNGPLSDSQVLARLLERDEEVFVQVVRAHGEAVHGMARRVLVDRALAEEVAQDTFVALWRRPGAFDPERGALRTFLLGVARNKAIDLVRKEESLRRAKDRLLDEAEASAARIAPDSAMTSSDDKAAIVGALRDLPKVQRDPLVLAYFGGRTYREVAVELEIPEGTAKSRMRDGLSALRARLADLRGSG